MIIPVSKLKFHAKSPFKVGNKAEYERQPLIWDRIDRRIKAGRPNVILIEGGGQVGKSRLAKFIAEHYDPAFIMVNSTQQLLDLMDVRVTAFNAGDRSMLWKWIFWDELQAEALKIQWSNQRNIVIGQIVGMWGELKQNLVVTCPDIDDISSRLFRNIACRIIVDAEWRSDHVQRTAFLFRPKKDIQKKGYKWAGAGMFDIPNIEAKEDYLAGKMENMSTKFNRFRQDLDRQTKKLYGPKEPEYIPKTRTEEEKQAKLAEIEEKTKAKPFIPPPLSPERRAELEKLFK